jgi:sugar (pentulose or hexulose) kinase
MDLTKTYLGIEFGSTRIKAVLIDELHSVIAQGSYGWENRLENNVWTYSLDEVSAGAREAFAELASDYGRKYGGKLTTVGAIGVSAMMHGYLAFDENGGQLAQFRTWRNTSTGKAADILTEKFNFNIPLRWSGAHYYQAILDNEEHVEDVKFLTTLAGYVHWKLTGKKVLGVGDASGMFPVIGGEYHPRMVEAFKEVSGRDILPLLPKILFAGGPADGLNAGFLTEEGAKLLDPGGDLKAGIPFCPPEGDAGTGMVATNAITPRSGNVSAGTSIFAMVVMENEVKELHREIDIVATPAGAPVAMVHCNNGTSDIDAWVGLFNEILNMPKGELFEILYKQALEGEADCGGLLYYNLLSGEPVVGVNDGKPLFVRKPESRLNLGNFMRSLLYSPLASLKIGMDILEGEGVKLERLLGHGGFFKTAEVGQTLMAGALGVPVAVMETAGEGGAFGMAVLAAFSQRNNGLTLAEYLDECVFGVAKITVVEPKEDITEGFAKFTDEYKKGLKIYYAG